VGVVYCNTLNHSFSCSRNVSNTYKARMEKSVSCKKRQ
jgi:hypothetical protein